MITGPHLQVYVDQVAPWWYSWLLPMNERRKTICSVYAGFTVDEEGHKELRARLSAEGFLTSDELKSYLSMLAERNGSVAVLSCEW